MPTSIIGKILEMEQSNSGIRSEYYMRLEAQCQYNGYLNGMAQLVIMQMEIKFAIRDVKGKITDKIIIVTDLIQRLYRFRVGCRAIEKIRKFLILVIINIK